MGKEEVIVADAAHPSLASPLHVTAVPLEFKGLASLVAVQLPQLLMSLRMVCRAKIEERVELLLREVALLVFLLQHHSMQAPFEDLVSQYLLLHSATCHQPVNLPVTSIHPQHVPRITYLVEMTHHHIASLTHAIGAINSLRVGGRVPRRVVDDNSVRPGERDAHSTHTWPSR